MTRKREIIIPSAEVVLVGGGHCHLEVVKRYGALRHKPFRLTLINATAHAPYIGHIPALISGEKNKNETHVDLGHLCLENGVRFIKRSVNYIDFENKVVKLKDHKHQVSFDGMSIDIGAEPDLQAFKGTSVEDISITVRPFAHFLEKLQDLEHTISEKTQEKPFHLVIVGGDAMAVEIALALSHRLYQSSRTWNKTYLHLIESNELEQGSYSPAKKKLIKTLLRKHRVAYKNNVSIKSYDKLNHQLTLSNDDKITCHGILWAYANKGPQWLKDTGIELDENGFILVQDNLESKSRVGVYAAGATASLTKRYFTSLSKEFTFGIGPILASNLIRRFLGERQFRYKPPGHPTILLSVSSNEAVASWGPFTFRSKLVQQFKNHFDEQWMRRYQVKPKRIQVATFIESGNLKVAPSTACGAKLPHDSLKAIPKQSFRSGDVVIGVKESDDASLISLDNPGSEKAGLIQSISHLRAFTKDLFTFGRMSAVHTINDVYSMGVKPHSAQVLATVPFAPKSTMERDLKDMMDGIIEVFDECGITLLGGYSDCGHEAAAGMLVQALSPKDKKEQLWTRGKLRPGDALILTKPLGTGILLTGYERFIVDSKHMWSAMNSMAETHAKTIDVCNNFNISAATDVTGYGLALCLEGLLQRSNLVGTISLATLPIYSGVLKALSAGIRSSIHIQNRIPFTKCIQNLSNRDLIIAEVMFDPQTAGPLLLGADYEEAPRLTKQLRQVGYEHASIIGYVQRPENDETFSPRITLKM